MIRDSVVVLYVPVLHEGYLKFFQKHKKENYLYIFGRDLVKELVPFSGEIRAVGPEVMAGLISSLGLFKKVSILNKDDIKDIREKSIISADEQISRSFFEKYLPKVKIKYDKVFLRWDETSIKSANMPKIDAVSSNDFDRRMVRRASDEAEKSSDWWRHVGAVVVKNGKIILEAHNHHLPSELTPYVDGDPRDFIEAGKFGDLSTAIHAEQSIISQAAREGISLAGADIYMNVFPCLICAKLIVNAGIKRCFFVTGNAYLDVEKVFKVGGTKIIKVNL